MRIIASALLLILVGGCAGGLSKEECLYADWRAIGYEDGARGAPTSAVSSHRQACAKKAGVTPDMSAYLAGRDAGLREYCQPSNGFAVGSRGGHYYGVCNGPEEGAFTAAYQQGNQLYALESDVARTSAALDEAHARYENIEHRISHAEVALVSPETPHAERLDILADIKNMQEEKRRIEHSFRPLRVEHERALEELADYRAFLVTEGPYPGAMDVTRASY
ncbi:DUF2799 domain-containing protein [Hyphococcus luteus]|uniref:DUF2799 domain-containing protein n=1 Tax=Hyphococcus luteus TaxID=2058213 RepID=A0A2S7K5K7_9PROT|nr:DUF2799 domain-containing protein [Marinicaulis flavus]PQA87761.1 hypothetical protein CW354_05215 [Marinicaulis flavus]